MAETSFVDPVGLKNVAGTAADLPVALTAGGGFKTGLVDALPTGANVIGAVTGSGTFTVAGTVTANAGTGTFTVGGTVTANAGTGTFTVGGTITANIGTSGSLALDATLAKLTIAQGAALGSNTQALVGGSVTTAAPSYTTGQISPLSLTTAGLLRTDGSGVTQPISGTVTANAGTGTFTVSGTVTANIGTSGSLALDATLAKLTIAQGAALGANTQALAGGSVTTAAPTYTTGQVSPLSLNTSGGLRVDGSGSTQPISGTITANQGGTWNVNNVSGTVSLPTGASTLAEQQTQTTSLQLIDDTVYATNGAISKTIGIGGQLDDAATTAATENNVAPLRITTQRGLHVNLRDVAGTEIGTAGAPVRTDPTGTTIQPVSGTVTANIGTSGSLALDATLAKLTIAQGASLGANTQALCGGSVTTAAPAYTTGQISPFSLTTTGDLRIAAASLPLPSGAATSANQSTEITSLQLIDDIVHSGDATLSKYAVIGAVYDDTSTGTVTENNAISLRMTKYRALMVGTEASQTADLSNVNTTYNNTTTSANSQDVDCIGKISFSLSYTLVSAGGPSNHFLDLIMQGKDADGNYNDIEGQWWPLVRYVDEAVSTSISKTLPGGRIPDGYTNIRLRVVATNTDATKTFTLSEAKIGLSSV